MEGDTEFFLQAWIIFITIFIIKKFEGILGGKENYFIFNDIIN